MVTWMTYAAGVAGLLAAGAFSLDRLCEKANLPRRFAWLAAMTLALLVPLFASAPEPNSTMAAPAATGAVKANAAPRTLDAVPPGGTIGETVAAGEAVGTGPATTERAVLAVWGFASLAALILMCTVLTAATLARKRWDRRRIAGEDVYVSSGFGPAVVGVARPAIVIPGWVVRLGEAVGATVVRHEREHVRAWDHLALLYSGFVLAAMPWNPALWWMFMRLRTAVEIDCDRRVLASGIPVTDYGDLLLDIGSGRPARPFFALTLVGSESMLERRLKAMRNRRDKARKSVLALLGCLALAAVVAACELAAPTGIVPAVNGVLEEAAPATVEARDNADTPAEAPPDQPGIPTVAAMLAATDEDGQIRIRGISDSPRLSLTPDLVARDPLVLVDGALLDGGLRELLASEPLDIEGIGYNRNPRMFGEFGDVVWRGIVIIRTKGSPSWGVSMPPQMSESWQRMAESWQRMARSIDAETLRFDAEARMFDLETLRFDAEALRFDEEALRFDEEILEEGGALIRGINRFPSVRLSAESAARDPMVLIDGVPLDGGLEALLAREPFHIGTIAYFRDPPRRFVEEFGDAASRGIVFINTMGSPSGEVR